MNRPKPALQSLQRIFLSRAGKIVTNYCFFFKIIIIFQCLFNLYIYIDYQTIHIVKLNLI